MKNLVDFINEALSLKQESVWKRSLETIKIQDKIRDFCISMKGKKVSLENQSERRKAFKDFMNEFGADNSKYVLRQLNNYGIGTEEGFANFMLNSHDELEKNRCNIDWIKQFDQSAMEKEYEKWKKSKDFIQGTKGEEVNKEEVEERDLVIYNRWDPTIFEVFPFYGKRGKDTNHQVNMCKVQFHYDYDVKYYDCYPILAKNYFGYENELPRGATLDLEQDPNEFK